MLSMSGFVCRIDICSVVWGRGGILAWGQGRRCLIDDCSVVWGRR